MTLELGGYLDVLKLRLHQKWSSGIQKLEPEFKNTKVALKITGQGRRSLK